MSNDDLVERLRCNPVWAEPAETQRRELVMAEAADRIEALEVKNAKLREMVTAQAEGAAQQAKENARLRAAMEWRPIESAPRDGTEFQAWIDDKFGWWEPRCRYDDGGNFQIWTRIDYDIEGWEWVPHLSPTHWTPVPTAPEGE